MIVLSTAQIMTGKLDGRGSTSPIRDLVDIAVCRIADPEALEVAVNSLDEGRLNGILQIYKETREVYDKATKQLEGVPATLEPIRTNPTGYATNAILESKYQRFEIHTREGSASITTTATTGKRTRMYTTAEELRDGMERDGINGFLAAQQRDKDAVLNATVDSMWAQHNTKILRIDPEQLQHEKQATEELTWTPPEQRESNAIRVPQGPPEEAPKAPPSPVDAARAADMRNREDKPGRRR